MIGSASADSGLQNAASNLHRCPHAGPPNQAYKGAVHFVVRKKGSIPALNAKAHPGFVNYRASNDRFTSHSEPTIAQDPLNPNHLMAGSKMYENNEDYLFKVGTYESFDGEMHVSFADLDDALELASIFYPGAVDEIAHQPHERLHRALRVEHVPVVQVRHVGEEPEDLVGAGAPN